MKTCILCGDSVDTKKGSYCKRHRRLLQNPFHGNIKREHTLWREIEIGARKVRAT